MKLKDPNFLNERNCEMCKRIFQTGDCVLENIKEILKNES